MNQQIMSLTAVEAREYCLQPELHLNVEGNALSYDDLESRRFIILAPVEIRQMITFITTLINAVDEYSSQKGRSLIWFGRADVGIMDSASLGRKTLESLRLANGDPRNMSEAPAQWFDKNSSDELKIFLLQAIMFGWPGYCLLDESNYIVNFTSSQRWFFRARKQSSLNSLFSAMKTWTPAYDSP